MKLHPTLVEKLITLYEINSGWPEEKRLRQALTELDVSTYQQKNGNTVLVSTKDLNEARKPQE
jgi:hypothetical protein